MLRNVRRTIENTGKLVIEPGQSLDLSMVEGSDEVGGNKVMLVWKESIMETLFFAGPNQSISTLL